MIRWVPRFIELIEDWTFLIKQEGWRSSRSQVLREICRLPYRRIEYVILAVTLFDIPEEFYPNKELKIRPFTNSDLTFVRTAYLPSEANLCRRRLQIGHNGFVAMLDNEVAGYTWLCSDTHLERIHVPLSQGDILANDAFTVPRYRNRGVKTALSFASMRWAWEQGYKRLIAYIDVNNGPSLSVWQRKMRAEILSRVELVRIGIWRKTRRL